MRLRVLFHAINGVGLGHLVRATCLAIEARARGHATLILTTAQDTSLPEREGLDLVQMPPRLGEPHASPGRARVALSEEQEQAACRAIFEAFGPDLVVFDTHAPAWLVAVARALGARVALVLRELRPAHFEAFVRDEQALSFDALIAPHDPGEFDTSAAPWYLPLRAVGAVVRGPHPRPLSRIPAQGPDAHSPALRLVILAGGGGQPVDAARYMQAAADAHGLLRTAFPALDTVLLTGPYGRPPARLHAGLRVERAVDAPEDLLAGADLVISQAGYNTVAELRMLRVPAVLVPGHRRAEDQGARARRLARLGAAVLARPDASDLADKAGALLASPERRERMRQAHARAPLVPRNADVFRALERVCFRPPGPLRRVVLVAHEYPPQVGGMETVARQLARQLAERGLDVLVLTCARLGIPRDEGVRVWPLFTPLPRPRSIDLQGDLSLTLAALGRDPPDLVHLGNAGLASWVPALQATLACPVTVHVHGNDLLAPWVHHGLDEASFADARRAGLGRADAVLAVSRFSGNLAEQAGASRVHVAPNGVDPARFFPGAAAPERLLLTVARLAPRKGHATVIRALPALLARHPDVRYAFTGEAEAPLAALLELARGLGVEDRVLPLGRVEDHDLPSLYRRASIFVLVPDAHERDVEGFGVALVEAAASGLPVVTSRTGGTAEAVEEGTSALLIDPGDHAQLAASLLALLDAPERAAAMGRAGRSLVERAFVRPADRVLQVFEELTARGPAGRQAAQDGSLAARTFAARTQAPRLARQRRYREASEAGKTVRLRAMGDGRRLLAAALEDCAAAGVRPDIEGKLIDLLALPAEALPLVGHLHAIHVVPSPRPGALLSRLDALPPRARFASLRLFVRDDVRGDDARLLASAPEAHALRAHFSRLGVPVVPPPELARYLSTTPAPGPATAMIEPTNRCNLRCPTCPTGQGKIPPLPDLPPARFAAVVAQLRPWLRNLALWNYGEPTLHPDLPALIAEAKRQGVGVVKVSSNVHFLDGERGRALLTSGLDVLILSVDGASPETYRTFRKKGKFDRVARTIERLCSLRRQLGQKTPRLEVQFLPMRHNEHEIEPLRELCKRWGVDRLRIKTFGAEDQANKALLPASRLLSRYGPDGHTPRERHPFCAMPWDHTVINVDGAVTPCCYLRPDMGSQFIMGNLFETPFLEIWRGERYQDFRRRMLEGRGAMPVCSTCRGGTHDLLASSEELS